MPVYAYRAMDLDAGSVAGTVVADTPRQARDSLRERGLTVTQVAAADEAKATAVGRLHRKRRGQVEVATFIRELATLLGAGIPLLTALQTLERQHRGRFRTAVQQLADQVASGTGLAEAMGRQPDIFDELCVSITQVGQNTGSLDSALHRLADFREKSERLRSRLVSALIYPAIVCVIGVAVSVFLMTFVVPNLLRTLTESGRELPVITRAVKAASDLLLGWWWAVLAGVIAIAVAVRLLLRTKTGRRVADRLILHLPLVGGLARKENTSRIAVVMAALLRSGVQFTEAIRITRDTVRNRVFRDALMDYQAAVAAGRDVAGPLAASGVFSPMVVQMLAVGQQAGRLEQMLEQVAEAYDRQVATATGRLTAALEPLLIVLLAVLVGFIALATILPILEISNVQ